MWTSLRLACLGAVFLAFTPWAHAQEEMAGTGDYLQSSQAFKDYMLQCAGCHRYDGQGLTHRGIPNFNQSIGLFTRLPAGRDYMIRVPGASQSQLDNADLARVLNWIVATLDQTLQILPGAWQPDKLLGIHIPGFGVLLTLLILLVVGAVASNFAGRKLVQWGDALVHRIPVVRSIYSSVKQVSDTLFSESGNAFRTAVLVQWPREGVWTVAFVTGAPNGEIAAYLRDEFVSVYVPTTPNPTGGYFVMVRKSDCVELDMSVDAALKYIVSMGVVAPADPTQLPLK